ncbi:MAG: hypothetical protein WCJ01_01975 [Ignavibacteria bacterium]
MKNLLLLLSLCAFFDIFAQDTTFTIENYRIDLRQFTLTVSNVNSKVYDKTFFSPMGYSLDMNNDGIEELIISDYQQIAGFEYYTIYVFNTSGSFYQTDSIYSGLKEPYFIYQDEIEALVLVTGSPDFDSMNSTGLETAFSPLTCWCFDDSSLAIVNDRLYDIFLEENTNNIAVLKLFYEEQGKDCRITEIMKPVIASIYINYIRADETAMAERTISQYYYCDDREKFRQVLINLL